MEELKTARAQLVHARIAPRKVQIVCDMIRGKDTKIAEAYMANTPKPDPQARPSESSGPYVPHQQAHQPHYHRRG